MRRTWLRIAMIGTVVVMGFAAGGLLAGTSALADTVSGTTGDVSYSATWTQGSGNQTTLVVTNTAGAGGQTISDVTFTISGSGVQITSASEAKNGSSSLCTGTGTPQIFCGTPINPGESVTITITTSTTLSPGAKASIVFGDSGDNPQPAVSITLQSPGSGTTTGGTTTGGTTTGGTTTGGGTAGGTDLVVSMTHPLQVELGSRSIPITVIVTNNGTVASSPTTLLVTTGETAAGENYGFPFESGDNNFGPAPHGRRVAVPGLKPQQEFERSYRLKILYFGRYYDGENFLPVGGTLEPEATLPADGDGNDRDDRITGMIELVVAGRSTATAVCGSGDATDRAHAAATSCRASQMHGFDGGASGRVSSVQIAVERIGKGAHAARASKPSCSGLINANGKLRHAAAIHGKCVRLDWLNAHGTTHWTYALHHRLPPGHYILYVRPVTPFGTPVTGFTAKAHNALPFTLR